MLLLHSTNFLARSTPLHTVEHFIVYLFAFTRSHCLHRLLVNSIAGCDIIPHNLHRSCTDQYCGRQYLQYMCYPCIIGEHSLQFYIRFSLNRLQMWIVILESYTEDRSKAKKSDGSVKNSGKILLFYFASNTQYYSEWSCLKHTLRISCRATLLPCNLLDGEAF